MGFLIGGNGTSLDQKLIDTDKTTNVATRHIFDGLDVTSHHKDGPLDGLLVQVLLLTGNEVGAHDTDLLAGSDLASEDAAEGVEAAFVGCGHHLGDVHHQGALGRPPKLISQSGGTERTQLIALDSPDNYNLYFELC